MVFIASIEVAPLPNSKMGKHGKGALVYCFIPADSEKIARLRLQKVIREDDYRLINIEFFDDYSGFQWETEQEQNEYDQLAEEARLGGDVVYGPFYVWKQENGE